MARLLGSLVYANADLKGSRHLAAPGSGAAGAVRAAAEAAAARVSSSSQAVARAVEYSQEPRLAAAYARGWEQGTEVDRLWESGEARKASAGGGRGALLPPHARRAVPHSLSTPRPPPPPPSPQRRPCFACMQGLIGQEEIMRSVPAPLLPPDVQAVFRAAERLAYVLRRAHVDSEDPDAPLRALRSRGLARWERCTAGGLQGLEQGLGQGLGQGLEQEHGHTAWPGLPACLPACRTACSGRRGCRGAAPACATPSRRATSNAEQGLVLRPALPPAPPA